MQQDHMPDVVVASDSTASGGPDSLTEAPAANLAESFAQPALAQLRLSTRARVWGDESNAASLEPTGTEARTPQQAAELRRHPANRCMFCALETGAAEVHNLNDNHRDTRPENLSPADAICHRWQHLGELGKGNALLVYLPGLAPRDASHLLRTTMIALQSTDLRIREEAQKVLNWMASHHVYVDDAWGTSDAASFGAALSRATTEDRDRKAVALAHLALVIHPQTIDQAVRRMRAELEARRHESTWQRVHHDVMNAPT